MSSVNLGVNHEARGSESIKEARLGVDTKLRMLEGTARILSENYGVQVVFSEDGECKTSRERMTLPYDEAIDEALIMGMMGHETGHLKDTDFDVAKTIAKMRTVKFRELLFNITNCLEDVRIEAIMEDRYPGFLTMFRRMVPYIQERKEPIIQIEELKRTLRATGMADQDVVKAVQEKNKKELIEKRKELLELYSDKLVDQLIDSEKARRENSSIGELQMIMDIVYLKLRGYEDGFYPQGVRAFAEDYVIGTAKEIFKCKTTGDVLRVAEDIYEILTNEKGTQANADKARQEMIKKCKQQAGPGGSGAPGKGQGGKLSKEELEKLKEEAQEKEKKAREERDKRRAEGADVEDFVKNKQGKEGEEKGEGKEKGDGKDEGEGETKTRFKPGMKVGSLDHDRKGTIVSVSVNGEEEEVEVDWE